MLETNPSTMKLLRFFSPRKLNKMWAVFLTHKTQKCNIRKKNRLVCIPVTDYSNTKSQDSDGLPGMKNHKLFLEKNFIFKHVSLIFFSISFRLLIP